MIVTDSRQVIAAFVDCFYLFLFFSESFIWHTKALALPEGDVFDLTNIFLMFPPPIQATEAWMQNFLFDCQNTIIKLTFGKRCDSKFPQNIV